MVVVPKNKKLDKDENNSNNCSNQQPINIYILSFDSISQMSFRRNLPKTVEFLENNDFAVFNGFLKIFLK